MSLLPNSTFANPGNSFYALAGGGADTLQSPVSLIPEANGSQSLEIVASTGSGEANLLVSSTNGNAATVTISNTTGGDALLLIGQTAAPGGTGAVAIYSPGNLVGGGQINISNATEIGTDADVAIFDTINNNVTLGSGKTAGLTAINNGLLVRDEFVTTPATNGIGITMTSANVGVIAGSATTGTNTLNIGSSATVPDIITLVDTGATTAQCIIGGNGGENLSIFGGTVANPAVGVNLRSDAASSGIMTIGSSVSNPTVMFVKDTGVANTGFVDIAGGIPPTIALRLQGANTQVGANTAQVSTNNNAAGTPTLNINNSVDGTPAIVVSNTTVRINKLITGYLNSTTAAQTALLDNNSAAIPGSDYGSLGAGLFTILVKTTNQTSPTGQVATQVSSMGYMSSNTQKWVGGNGFGQALINPTRNFFIQVSSDFTGLVFGNTSGFDMNATWTVTFIRLSGDLGI